MKGFTAVFQKEVTHYFVSPIAYAVLVVFLVIAGFMYRALVINMALLSLEGAANPMLAERLNTTDLVIRPLMQNIGFILLFVLPFMTMRLFSEEKKSGAIELLLTYAVTDLGVILGKFFAAGFMLLVMLLSLAPSFLMLFALGNPDPGMLLSGYLGLALMGIALLALGIFISSLTENQIVAVAVTFGAVLLLWILPWAADISDGPTGAFLRQLSILQHTESFNKGIIALSDVSFFVLFAVFFLFMTMRSLEAKKWRG